MRFLKLFIFIAVFVILSKGLTFLLKNDTNSYSRTISHEFYQQERVDALVCGASHVSHGIDCRIADKEFDTVFLMPELLARYKWYLCSHSASFKEL